MSSSSDSSNDSGPEVGSLFSFEPYILEPFMGVHSVDRPDDPWHHKSYNLYRPIYTGGGTFEQYLNAERYKRDLDAAASSPFSTFNTNSNVLTPDMMNNLLRIKSNFKNNYPVLYKSMMGQFAGDKSTAISVTLPEVPKHVSHKNLELAAAEINPLETLIPTYEEDLKKIMEEQRQRQENSESFKNSYKNEFNFWNTNPEKTHILSSTQDQAAKAPYHKETRSWEDSRETLNKVRDTETFLENPNKVSLNEPQSFWQNTRESLNTLTKPELLFQNPPENINKHSVITDNSQEHIEETQSFWKNPQETIKTLGEHSSFLSNPKDSTIEEQSFWQTSKELESNTNTMPQENLNTEERKIWESPKESVVSSALHKRSSFWAELEASEKEQEHQQHHFEDLEPIFDFDEDFD